MGFGRFKFQLVAEWHRIVRKAWSVRLLAIAGVLSGIEAALPFTTFISIPQGVFAILSALATGGAFIARLVAQKDMQDD